MLTASFAIFGLRDHRIERSARIAQRRHVGVPEVDGVQILREAFRSCDSEQPFRKFDPGDAPLRSNIDRGLDSQLEWRTPILRRA
jgi:hypothetical protein